MKPFVCISEQCNDTIVGFAKYSSWRKHMDDDHGANWTQYTHNTQNPRRSSEKTTETWNEVCLFCQTQSCRLEDERSKIRDQQLCHTDEHGSATSNSLNIIKQRTIRHIAAHLQTLCFQTIDVRVDEAADDAFDQKGESQEPATEGSSHDNSRSTIGSISVLSDQDSGNYHPKQHEHGTFSRLISGSLSSIPDGSPAVEDWVSDLRNAHPSPEQQPSPQNSPDIYKRSSLTDASRRNRRHLKTSTAPTAGSSYTDTDSESEDGDLRTLLNHRLITPSTRDSRPFLPIDALKKTISRSNVRRALRNIGAFNEADINNYTSAVCDTAIVGKEQNTARQRLFAILVIIDGVKLLPSFISEGIHDIHLPFDIRSGDFNPGLERHLFYQSSEGAKALFEGSRNWKILEIVQFFEKQWLVLSPVFDMREGRPSFHLLEPHAILPFVEVSEGDNNNLWRIKIHPAHHNYSVRHHEHISKNQD